jgi:hypothetical protein
MGFFKRKEPTSHISNLPLTLNLEVEGGKVVPIIRAGAPLPAEWSEDFGRDQKLSTILHYSCSLARAGKFRRTTGSVR